MGQLPCRLAHIMYWLFSAVIAKQVLFCGLHAKPTCRLFMVVNSDMLYSDHQQLCAVILSADTDHFAVIWHGNTFSFCVSFACE